MRNITKYKVKCVTMETNPDYEDCRGIAEIGFPGERSDTVTRTPAQVYDMIDNGDTVVVEHEGDETRVRRAKHEETKYVRTEPNDTKEDNLLKQESC